MFLDVEGAAAHAVILPFVLKQVAIRHYHYHQISLSSALPVLSLGFTFFGEIFASMILFVFLF